MNNDDDLSNTTGFDTDVRKQGDRETRTSEGRERKLPAPFKPGEICGEFQLGRMLGQGSSGSVFRAFDTVSRRSCALKILTASKQHDLRRNKIGFRRMMGVLHPNLMRVDQMHQLDGYIALSMEEIHGDTLARARRRYRQLGPRVAYNRLLSLTRDYAAGLARIHSRGLLHRDIKPSNLMVDRHERGRIIDYGLVGEFDSGLDSNCYRDYIAGTPRYISPEAYFDQRYTPAGDIFSLGLVVLELLQTVSGQDDWSRSKETRDEDAMLINSAVDQLNKTEPNMLREACLEMLQYNPADRPTAAQIARLGMPTGRNTVYMGGQPLFGRDHEFNQACDWLGEIYDGKHGRLHIHGPSGIGKSALVDAIEQYLRSLNWGQVFRAQCRPREMNSPLQAFDQVADQISNRYSKSDREKLELDPVSVSVLHTAHPVLKEVVQANLRVQLSQEPQDRIDLLQAVVNLSKEIRKIGPVILIMDDVQWADGDTNSVLDALQTCGGGMLGIITVSRSAASGQQQPPQATIDLQPLGNKTSIQILSDAAKRSGVNAKNGLLQELSDAAAGNPYRLSELANEFRVGGLLHAVHNDDEDSGSVSRLGNLDRLWRLRVQRLGTAARTLLPYIATAGCPVSITQLERLSGLYDDTEIAVSELVHQRLILDDATSDACIQMIHDRVADGVVSKLDDSEHQQAHLAWANLLRTDKEERQRESNAGRMSRRIARHLIDAGRSEDARSYCSVAAEEAERAFAFQESAEWHLKLYELTEDPDEQKQELREAARCFLAADQPVRVAEVYSDLIRLEDDTRTTLSYQVHQSHLLARGGRFGKANRKIDHVANELGLGMISRPSLARNLLSRLGSFIKTGTPKLYPPLPGQMRIASESELLRMAFCKNLVRPMLFQDTRFAMNLYRKQAKLINACGSKEDRIDLALMSTIIASCDRSPRQTEASNLLRNLQAAALEMSPKIKGDYWVAKALNSLLTLNWNQIHSSVGLATSAFKEGRQACLFEIAQTKWISLTAFWFQGDWKNLSKTSMHLAEDALNRDDRISHFTSTSGFSASGWLIRDDVDSYAKAKALNLKWLPQDGPITKLLQYIAESQKLIYQADFHAALDAKVQFFKIMDQSFLKHIQFARIISNQLRAVTALHLLKGDTSATKYRGIVQAALFSLRDEDQMFSTMLADHYEGLMKCILGDKSAGRELLVSAKQLAIELELQPFKLASEDALMSATNEYSGLLTHKMRSQGVKSPEALERIYTVSIED